MKTHYRRRPEIRSAVPLKFSTTTDSRSEDLNKNGEIDTYEDWRKPTVEARVADLLVSQMTLAREGRDADD